MRTIRFKFSAFVSVMALLLLTISCNPTGGDDEFISISPSYYLVFNADGGSRHVLIVYTSYCFIVLGFEGLGNSIIFAERNDNCSLL